MEEFGTIVWSLVVIAMLIARVAGLRKRREAGEQPPVLPHGEAWPQMEPLRPDSTESGFPEEARSLETIPDYEAAQEPAEGPATARSGRVVPAAQPAGPDRPQETRSMQPETLRDARPKNRRTAAPGQPRNSRPESSRDTRPAERLADRPAGRNGQPSDNSPVEHGGQPSDDSRPSEGISSALGEPFDLRRAVIYSELLKPKFEEE